MKAKITFIEETHRIRKVVREEIVSDDSGKRLTKGRASRILSRHFPDLKTGHTVTLIDTDRGWCALRTKEIRKNVWLHVYVSKTN
jgi:hypothetical protein